MATWNLIYTLVLVLALLVMNSVVAVTFSSKLIHRFSDEVRAFSVSRSGGNASGSWPERGSLEYYKALVNSDLERQKMKLGSKYDLLFPSEGSKTMSFGNEFGWLHYTWIDIGTPNVSFLVALDAGSDLLWVPCDCIQCAPLSSSYYDALDRDLSEYSPSRSSTSKRLACSHQLCELGPKCKSPKPPCPYTVNYYSENTSSSGLLVEDTIYLESSKDRAPNSSVQAQVILGCGRMQSGGYLDGVAPDGLIGLGLGEISVPSFLAKAGLIRNSFSLCFNEDDNGRIFFGDKGLATQHTTSFLPSDGKYLTYIVGVEASCVGNSCPEDSGFKALVDSGTSFTFLPAEVYEKVVQEFDREVDATSASYDGYPWKYCYNSIPQESSNIPSLTFMFPQNNSFMVHNPVFFVYGKEGVVGFCLAIQPADGDVGTIGQNYMTGHRMVFDRENLTLGWSHSTCNEDTMPLTTAPNGKPPNSLPTNEQQSTPGGHTIAPAVAGRASSKSSVNTLYVDSSWFGSTRLILSLLLLASVL
ncbi:Xylanase inhibitor, C-terminal [Dillenia turbinata]|uniref:Xylanase inhibitor, C-terminal n=1 Tax=Dillenia turbinata TaxID=194707 RepID=A0AAN8Z387_9MAGN